MLSSCVLWVIFLHNIWFIFDGDDQIEINKKILIFALNLTKFSSNIWFLFGLNFFYRASRPPIGPPMSGDSPVSQQARGGEHFPPKGARPPNFPKRIPLSRTRVRKLVEEWGYHWDTVLLILFGLNFVEIKYQLWQSWPHFFQWVGRQLASWW